MKYFLIALLVIIIAGYFYIKKILDNFAFGDAKFVGGNIRSILSGEPFTAIKLSSTIDNKNSFSVPVSGLYIEVYHQGDLVGSSVAPHEDFIIPANGNFTIDESMIINVGRSLSIAAKILTKAPIVFDYRVKAKLFGFYTLTYNDNFTY